MIQDLATHFLKNRDINEIIIEIIIIEVIGI
jgi:hypothetical protein